MHGSAVVHEICYQELFRGRITTRTCSGPILKQRKTSVEPSSWSRTHTHYRLADIAVRMDLRLYVFLVAGFLLGTSCKYLIFAVIMSFVLRAVSNCNAGVRTIHCHSLQFDWADPHASYFDKRVGQVNNAPKILASLQTFVNNV